MVLKFKAFTMVEILVVVAVIGFLLSVVIPNITQVRNRSKDEAKVATLGVVESAINQYRQACGTFPFNDGSGKVETTANNGVPAGSTCPDGVTLAKFLPNGFPNKIADITYYPVVRGGQTNYQRCTSYRLGTQLSGVNAVPIKRAASRGWDWATSSSTFGWIQCSATVGVGGTAVPAFGTDIYDAVAPSPY